MGGIRPTVAAAAIPPPPIALRLAPRCRGIPPPVPAGIHTTTQTYPLVYRQRNLIERMFGRLKDFRRITTRYDKLARNFLAGVALAAILTW
jgi:putative transposase